LGSLFYDTDFGSLIHDWILEESTQGNRAAFCAEVIMRVELDPRVVASVRWQFIGEDQPFNLVMQLDKATKELIIQDAKPDPDSFSAHIS
jgi:hypothetical protein